MSEQGDIPDSRDPPSEEAEDIPDSKRQRPRSVFRAFTSPVLRQATTFAEGGLFDDYEGLIFKRGAGVLFPCREMVFMAVVQIGQMKVLDWLLTLTEVRSLTTSSKKWAAERPTCLSLLIRKPDGGDAPEAQGQPTASESILRAPFGCISLSRAATLMRPRAPGSSEAHAATTSDSPFVLVSDRHLATMEWIPITMPTAQDITLPPTPSYFGSGTRQGSSVQGRLSGRGFPFATQDLPGKVGTMEFRVGLITTNSRYDGEGCCESDDLPKTANHSHTTVSKKQEYAFVRMYVHRDVVCGCHRVGDIYMYVTCPLLTCR
jgi:hypothetical protein